MRILFFAAVAMLYSCNSFEDVKPEGMAKTSDTTVLTTTPDTSAYIINESAAPESKAK